MREVARKAHCNNALIGYYFGSKQLLFRECFNLPLDPAQEVLRQLAPGPEGAGERLTRHALWLYEEQLTADTMQALMRALMTDTATSQRFRTYIRSDVLAKIGERSPHPERVAEEIELAMATMYGVVTMRYLVKLEPIASMTKDSLVRAIAPIMQYRVDRIFALLGYPRSTARPGETPREPDLSQYTQAIHPQP